MPRNFFSIFIILGVFCFLQNLAHASETFKCAICGMGFKAGTRTSFESTREGKPIHFCSFVCAHRFHKKFKDEPLYAVDFDSGSRIETKNAFFLIKSSNVLKELEFDMPPSVVAFSKEDSAKKVQARLKDGEVVKGYEALEKAFN